MKNKTKLLFAGILAAFLMLAVPFAVVSFDADDADATSYTEVGNWDQLETAINNSEISAIKFVNNIVYESDTEGEYGLQITRSMEIDGNGYTLSRMTESSVDNWGFVNISGIGNGEVTIKGLTIDFAGGNRSRSINVVESQNLTLNIFNTKINNGTHYPLFIGSDSVNVNITSSGEKDKESELRGYCAIRIEANNASINVTDTRLIGNNTYSGVTSSYCTIMVNNGCSANITLENTDVTSIYENDVPGYQYAFYFYEGATGSVDIKNNVTFKTLNGESPADTYFGAGDAVAIFNGTLKGKVEATEVDSTQTFSITGYDGNSLSGLKVYGDAISNDAKCNISVSNIKTADAGILVKNAGDVTISNCEVTGSVALEQDFKTNGGILVSQSNSATILDNIVTCNETEDGKSFFGVGVQKVRSAVISYNEIYGIDNAVWADMTLPNEDKSKVVGSSVTINGNSLKWGSNQDGFEGRGIRSESYETVMINGNTFIPNPNETIDVGNVAKITYTGKVQFKGNFIGANKADCGIDFIDSTGKDVFVDIASNFGTSDIAADGNWYISKSIKCSLMTISGNVVFGSDFVANNMMEFGVPYGFSGSISISAKDGASFNGLYVRSYWQPSGNPPQDIESVSISNIKSSNGISVIHLNGDVTIEDCTIIGNIGGNKYNHKIGGICVNIAKKTTINNNVIDFDGEYSEGYFGIDLLRCGPTVIVTNNKVYDAPDNAFCYQNNTKYSKSDVVLTISGNTFSEWACSEEEEGRGIRAASIKDIYVQDNQFLKSYSGSSNEDGNLMKVTAYTGTFEFERNFMNGYELRGDIKTGAGSDTFIDAGTIFDSLEVKSGEIYNCFDVTINDVIEIEDGGFFSLVEGGSLYLEPNATITGTINGPDDTCLTLTNIKAGDLGISIVGGSITLHGSVFGTPGSSVVVNSDDITLDGEFTGAIVRVESGYTVGVGDELVFSAGTEVVLESDAEFSKDPVFEAGTKLKIGTGSSAEVIEITETSKVSSSGVVRTSFDLMIDSENGTVYYNGLETYSIKVFVGDKYGEYLDGLYVKPDAGYIMFRWVDSNGMPVVDSTTIDEGDELVAVCAPVPVSSEVEESAGFDIADHVVLIEAVIAVLVLIGFVAYIRKN